MTGAECGLVPTWGVESEGTGSTTAAGTAVATVNPLLTPVCPLPSLAVITTLVSALLTVTLPVHTPATKLPVVDGVSVFAPPLPAAVKVAVPV